MFLILMEEMKGSWTIINQIIRVIVGLKLVVGGQGWIDVRRGNDRKKSQ